VIPSAVKSLSQPIDTCLTFFKFPDEEWISLRTENVIERLNREFKKRTTSMKIVAGKMPVIGFLRTINSSSMWRQSF